MNFKLEVNWTRLILWVSGSAFVGFTLLLAVSDFESAQGQVGLAGVAISLSFLICFPVINEITTESISETKLEVPPNPKLNIFMPIAMRTDSYHAISCVYIIQELDLTGYCKIGYSTTFDIRMEKFAAKFPFRWHLVGLIPSNNPQRIERELHRHFAKKRRRGEWFELSSADIDYLRDLERAA